MFEAWLLSSPPLPSLQVNMADSHEWIFRLFGRHHRKSRIFERMENFQNDWCRPWTKKPFKNSCSRKLRIVNAVVSWSPAGQIAGWPKSVFSPRLRRWWHLWMESKGIEQSYRVNIFRNVSLVCFIAELQSTSKMIHNRCTCKNIKTLRLHTHMQAND